MAGSLLSLMMRQSGFKIDVYEKRVDPRFSRIPEGRSINLALSHRGIQALKMANVFDHLSGDIIPMKGRMIHDLKGETVFQPYGKEGQHINSISRNELNKALIQEAENAGVKFHFGYKCERVDLDSTAMVVYHNGKYESIQSDGMIGTDGAFSAVRKAFQSRDRFNFQQEYIGHGYKELAMPPKNGDFAMEPNYLHIWPRGNFMLIALPNPDKTFTCTLFLSFEGEVSFENLTDSSAIESFFTTYFQDALGLIPDLLTQFTKNPTSSLVTIRCDPWHYKNSLILGDAAHAIVPFYGQGMNAAFEDCRIFMEMGRDMGFEWAKWISRFSSERKKDADAIADLALRNFVEMRDQVADDKFLERKKIDAELHERYGNSWIPMYSLVTFSDVPYHKALAQGLTQEKALIKAQQRNYMGDYDKIYEDAMKSSN